MHHIDHWFSIAAWVIRCQIAAAIHIGEVETADASKINHVNSDVARDVAVDVGATESVGDVAALQIKGDVAVDVGRFIDMSLA